MTISRHWALLIRQSVSPAVRPLPVRRWAGRGPAERVATEVLGLSKMNWNNDAFYDTLPTTFRIASTLADVLETMPSLGHLPYSYRLFI